MGKPRVYRYLANRTKKFRAGLAGDNSRLYSAGLRENRKRRSASKIRGSASRVIRQCVPIVHAYDYLFNSFDLGGEFSADIITGLPVLELNTPRQRRKYVTCVAAI